MLFLRLDPYPHFGIAHACGQHNALLQLTLQLIRENGLKHLPSALRIYPTNLELLLQNRLVILCQLARTLSLTSHDSAVIVLVDKVNAF